MAAQVGSTEERGCAAAQLEPLSLFFFSLTLIVSAPELCMRVHVNGRQSDFKPDPVCAFNSARKDFAVDRGYVVGWYVIFVVDGFVDT
jgi:hypothetical protein